MCVHIRPWLSFSLLQVEKVPALPRREVGSQVLEQQQEPGLIILRGGGCSS